MSEEDKNIDDKIFEEPTAELIDLNSSQETNSEVQILDEVSVVDNNDNEVKVIEEVEEEAIHRLRPVPSPPKRYIRDSQLNPEIHLDGGRIPVVRLDRNEVTNYFRAKKSEKKAKEAENRCQAQIDLEAIQNALDRQAQLRVMRRVAEAEKVAKAAQKSSKIENRKSKSKGKYPKNIRKIVKKSSLTRAEMSLAPPVASLHPEAPRTSTPKRIALEDLRDGLRHCTQHCSSFYNSNGQPPLYKGTWPDHLSWDEARKAYRRQVKTAERHPSLLEQLERPSVYDSVAEINDAPDVNVEEDVPDAESEVENDLKIPSAEEIIENIENPTPSTSKGITAKPVCAAFPIDKFGSLITHGQNLFLRGADFDGQIEENLEKLRRAFAMKYALEKSTIDVTASLLASQGVQEDIAKYKNRIEYMIGKRRRILDIVTAQQEQAEEAINNGIEPTLAQLGFTTVEAQGDDMQEILNCSETQDYEEEVEIAEPEPEPEVVELETEDNQSHISSNLSFEGLCDPMNPCQGEGPCRHMGGE